MRLKVIGIKDMDGLPIPVALERGSNVPAGMCAGSGVIFFYTKNLCAYCCAINGFTALVQAETAVGIFIDAIGEGGVAGIHQFGIDTRRMVKAGEIQTGTSLS